MIEILKGEKNSSPQYLCSILVLQTTWSRIGYLAQYPNTYEVHTQNIKQMVLCRILMLILHLLKTKINKKTNLWHKPKKIKNKNKHQRRNSNKWDFPGFEQCHGGEPSLPKAKTIEGRPKMDNKHIIH